MADERRIITIANTLLEETAAGMEANGYHVPSMRFLSPGLPAFDDEMFCVSMPRIVPRHAEKGTYRGLHGRSGEFITWMVLPSPSFITAAGNVVLPDAAELDEAAELLYGGMIAGINGVLAAAKTGGRFATDTVMFEGADTVGPNGGFMAALTRWTINLVAEPS